MEPDSVKLFLTFTYPEHLGAAFGAGALGGWFLVLHGDLLGVLDINLVPTFHTISLHWTPPFGKKHKANRVGMSIGVAAIRSEKGIHTLATCHHHILPRPQPIISKKACIRVLHCPIVLTL